jgi:hypothetical protein
MVARGEWSVKHGEARVGKETKEYICWQLIRTRCNNVKSTYYKNYGGRGISVCSRWMEYQNFLSDMGRAPSVKHQIDRIDNDGNYEPGNCRWVTRTENMRNTRRKRMVNINGENKMLIDVAREYGISNSALDLRLRRGWSIEEALNTPARK